MWHIFQQLSACSGSACGIFLILFSIFNTENKTKFRDALNSISWTNVLRSDDANVAFEEFWDIFYPLFELYFPLTTVKFNKNVQNLTIL